MHTTEILLYNEKDADLGVQSKDIRAKFSFDIRRVESFRQSFDDNHIPDGIVVYFKSGLDFYIKDDFESFKLIMKNVWLQ